MGDKHTVLGLAVRDGPLSLDDLRRLCKKRFASLGVDADAVHPLLDELRLDGWVEQIEHSEGQRGWRRAQPVFGATKAGEAEFGRWMKDPGEFIPPPRFKPPPPIRGPRDLAEFLEVTAEKHAEHRAQLAAYAECADDEPFVFDGRAWEEIVDGICTHYDLKRLEVEQDWLMSLQAALAHRMKTSASHDADSSDRPSVS